MKFTLTCDEQQLGHVEVHFSMELPVFPKRTRYSSAWPQGRSTLPGRHSNLVAYAGRLVRANRGRFSVEMTRPYATYLAFLEELVTIEGLEEMCDTSRYSLTIAVARCFDRQLVAQQTANCVCRHFYPEERAELDLRIGNNFSHHLGEDAPGPLPDPTNWTGVDRNSNH